MLIVFSGLPGTGKTSIATRLAGEMGAVYLRIDSIEQAMRDSGLVRQSLDDAGYRVAYAVAEDNLRLGRTVIADSVNPIRLTRDAWVGVAQRGGIAVLEVEVICSDPSEHRRRVESRTRDIAGLRLPTWDEVCSREYHTWDREHITLDTSTQTVEQSVARLRACLTSGNSAQARSR